MTAIRFHSRDDQARLDRTLGELFSAQEAALGLLETLEAAGEPVHPALAYLLGASWDASRALRDQAGLAGPRLVISNDDAPI